MGTSEEFMPGSRDDVQRGYSPGNTGSRLGLIEGVGDRTPGGQDIGGKTESPLGIYGGIILLGRKRGTEDDFLGDRHGCTVGETGGYLDGVTVVGDIPNIIKSGSDKGIEIALSCGTIEVTGIGEPEYGSAYIEDSSLGVTLGTEGVYYGDSYGGMLYGNEKFEGLALVVSLGTVILSGIGMSNDM